MSVPEPVAAWLGSMSGLELVLSLSAVIGVLWVIGRWVKGSWKGLKRFVATIDSLADLPTFMKQTTSSIDQMQSSLAEVRHEVLPNDGGSLRDAVDNVDRRVQIVEAHQDNDHQRIAELRAAIRPTPTSEGDPS